MPNLSQVFSFYSTFSKCFQLLKRKEILLQEAKLTAEVEKAEKEKVVNKVETIIVIDEERTKYFELKWEIKILYFLALMKARKVHFKVNWSENKVKVKIQSNCKRRWTQRSRRSLRGFGCSLVSFAKRLI